jgi:hypothetical protein
VVQAFSPAHVNSAWMAVGAYPSTWADVTKPQVRTGAKDSASTLKMDNNERVARQLFAVLEERGSAQAVKDAGLWDRIGEHSDTCKRAETLVSGGCGKCSPTTTDDQARRVRAVSLFFRVVCSQGTFVVNR